MNYSKIKYCDIANGPGVRTSVFVSGCRRHCPGCFNPETWDFNNGYAFTDAVIKEIVENSSPDYVAGLSILGGEPFEIENHRGVLKLISAFKKKYKNKTAWVYTGDTIENILFLDYLCIDADYHGYSELLYGIDVLVDGPYIEEQRDITLRFCGSRNQRLIDMKKTFAKHFHEIVLWEDKPVFSTHTM